MYIPSFKLISQSMLKSGKCGRTDGQTDGRTDGHCHGIIRRFSNGRIKRDDSRRSRPASRSRPERGTRSPSPSRPSRDSSRYPRRSPSPRRPSHRESRRTPSPRWPDYHRRSRSQSPHPTTRKQHRYGWTREDRELEEAISAILSRTGRH